MSHRLAIPTLLLLVTTVAPAGADFTGPYGGQLTTRRPRIALDAAAALTQSGRTVTGTIALGGAASPFDAPFAVSGIGGARRFRVAGANPSGARVTWRGVVTPTGVGGRIKLRGPAARLAGKVTLARRTSGGNGESCDAVFTENQGVFTAEVMDAVLAPVCATCHMPGGQAQSTRLTVLRGDPLVTARSVALMVDAADPAASPLVRKPTAAVPHGGGQQLAPGGPGALALERWATLVAQASCIPQGGGPQAGPFSACASCHGADGAGGTSGPDVRCAAPSFLADAVRRGRGTAMPPAVVSNAELQAIADYLDARCSRQPADVYAANCASCHGPTAGGGRDANGVPGPNIRCSDDFSEALRRGPDDMPPFPSFTAGQVARLATWVRGFCGPGGGDDD